MALKGNARKTYKTMRGRAVDMEQLQQRNELTPAVGNARVNARGDELGAGGQIVRKKEDLLKEYYEKQSSVPEEPMPAKETASKEVPTETSAKANKTTRAQKKVAVEPKGIDEDPKMASEFGDDEDWVEDADGNFIPKGE
jgi:hypothetical protein